MDTTANMQSQPDPRVRTTGQLTLPPNHPQRFLLNSEVHARPPEPLTAPCRLSYLALYSGDLSRETQIAPLVALATAYGGSVPSDNSNHFAADVGPFRIKWECHTEFVRYTFIVPEVADEPFANPAIGAVPRDWLATLPGELVVAAHAVLVTEGVLAFDPEQVSRRFFNNRPLIGSAIAGGGGKALTDLQIHGDGFSRILVENRSMTEWQAGRLMQRLFEIETYRILALMTLPVARDLAPFLGRGESELTAIMHAMTDENAADEPALLDRLTGLEAAIESRYAGTSFRFGAAAAYYGLVQRRIEELREDRIEGLQTFDEFVQRRLAPAMSTCQATAERQQSLSERVMRAVQLLSTRVDVSRQRQNQDLLSSMNRRAELQLKLQQTVEALSIAAVTYYVVSLIGYAAEGLDAAGVAVDPTIAMALSIPIVAVVVVLAVRKVSSVIRLPDQRRRD